MTRTIERTYEFTERDVREALLLWLKTKDMPRPEYLGDTDTVKWIGPGDAKVVWIDKELVE